MKHTKNAVYFVEIYASQRQPYFQEEALAEPVIEELCGQMREKAIRLYCFCLLPETLSLLFSLSRSAGDLTDWIVDFKQRTQRQVAGRYLLKVLWHWRFLARPLNSIESVSEKMNQIIQLPVKRKLVMEWESYPYAYVQPWSVDVD